MPAPARNVDPGSPDHARLDHASRGLAGERHAFLRSDELRLLGERLQHALAQGGVSQLLRRGLNHVASPWVEFGSVTFFRRRLDLAPEVARSRPGLAVLHASLGDVPLVLEASDPRRTPEIVRERLGRGDLCFLALDTAGRPIHSGWATRLGAHVPELERDIILRSHEAYLYDAFTPPARRGHGAFGFVLDHLFADLQTRGAQVVYSYVRGDDPRGQRAACVRLRPIGTIVNIRLRGRAPMVFGGSSPPLPMLVHHLVDDEGRVPR
jgi:hypothetical protein